MAEIEPNTSDLDRMIHEKWFIYTTEHVRRVLGTTHLTWIPVDHSITPPDPSYSTPNDFQVDSPYYYCYDYDHVLKIVNNGLNESRGKLKIFSKIFFNTHRVCCIGSSYLS